MEAQTETQTQDTQDTQDTQTQNPANTSTSEGSIETQNPANPSTISAVGDVPYVVDESYIDPETTETQETETPEQIYANKFKSVEDLEKSYLELQSTFSKKLGDFQGAPEEYQLPEDLTLTPDREVLVQELKEWGKNKQLSQEGFNELLQNYDQWEAKAKQEQIKLAYQELGANADQRIKNVREFLLNTVGEDGTDALAQTMLSAKSIEAIERLMQKQSQVLGSTVKSESKPELSKESLEAMRFKTNENGERLMSIDPKYREKVLKLEQEFIRSGGELY